jgi:hypothetical protein
LENLGCHAKKVGLSSISLGEPLKISEDLVTVGVVPKDDHSDVSVENEVRTRASQ